MIGNFVLSLLAWQVVKRDFGSSVSPGELCYTIVKFWDPHTSSDKLSTEWTQVPGTILMLPLEY